MSLGFNNFTVGQIREALQAVGMSEEETKRYVGKAAVVDIAIDKGLTPNKIQELLGDTEQEENPIIPDLSDLPLEDHLTLGNVENIEFEQDELPELSPQNDDSDSPSYCSPEWHDYVISHLQPNEFVEIENNKYPKVSGLRRVGELLLGEVVFSGPVDVKCTLPEGDTRPGRAVCTYELKIAWKNGIEVPVTLSKLEYPVRTFRSVANAYPGNLTGLYIKFPEAIAETRAEGRAWKKALNLQTQTAEEMDFDQKPYTVEDPFSETAISDNQKAFIHTLCSKLNIDTVKFISYITEGKVSDLDSMSREQAMLATQKLNAYQQSGKTSEVVPVEILIS